MLLDWFRSRASLLAELRHSRLCQRQAYTALVVAHRESGMWQELASCNDPANHRRLAQQLHQAQVALAEARGEDPHEASL